MHTKQDLGSEARHDKAMLHIAELEHICSRHFRGAVEVTGFSVRCPESDWGEFLLVVRGLDEAGCPVVGFHSATSVVEVLAGGAKRLGDGTLTWKEDKFRGANTKG